MSHFPGNLIISVCQHYGLGVEYFNEEETPNLLETPRLELMSALPSVSHRKGFLGRRENRAENLLLELNRRIEEFNQKMKSSLRP